MPRRLHSVPLDAIVDVLQRHPMTVGQIARRFGISPASARVKIRDIRAQHHVVAEGERLERTYRVAGARAGLVV